MGNLTISGPGRGFQPDQDDRYVFTRVACSRGDLLQLDLPNDDADVDNNTLASTDATTGEPNSGFNNVVDPPGTPTQESHGIFCIALEAGSADTWIKVRFRGIVEAFIHDNGAGSGSAAAGDHLTRDDSEVNALTFDTPDATDNKKILGIALEAVATPATPTLGDILFDGVHGFGSVFTETP